MLEIHKLVINKWRESAFPTGVKDYGAAHKEHLRAILFHTDITKILGGHIPTEIGKWITQPWLMPVVQI
eukprot:1909402-Rhodomonas_salina.1